MTDPIAVSIKTAAALTEMSETTIRAEISAGALAAHRIGRSIRIRPSDLDEWVRSQARVGDDR